MSGLAFDKNFYSALIHNTRLKALTEDRIFNTARPEIDDEEDRIPYIIITNEGVSNESETKDFEFESSTDLVTITVLIVMPSRESLAEISEMVRDTIATQAKDWEGLLDYQFGAGPVQFDSMKPCHFVQFTYRCEVENL